MEVNVVSSEHVLTHENPNVQHAIEAFVTDLMAGGESHCMMCEQPLTMNNRAVRFVVVEDENEMVTGGVCAMCDDLPDFHERVLEALRKEWPDVEEEE